MNLYILPTSDQGMGGHLFDKKFQPSGGLHGTPFWSRFKEAGGRNGVNIMTSDAWSRENRKDDDVLVVQNHPGETWPWRLFYYLKQFKTKGGFVLLRRQFFLKNYKYFDRRVLFQTESPAIMPYMYGRALEKLRDEGVYQKIYLLSRRGGDYGYFNYYDYREGSIESPYFDAPKEKFLIMVNANMAIHSFKNELYGERIRAIRYFAGIPGFDLYGYEWERYPRHPFHFFAGSRVRSAWRGVVSDKIQVMSKYKFALCFENCSYPGYVSEKIYDCLASGSIPIYLGAPDIGDFVPPPCFIDFRKFKSYPELREFLRRMTNADIETYHREMLTFMRNKSTLKKLDDFILEIVAAKNI